MTNEYFGAVLAPLCFSLLSDKVKERTNALVQIRRILPDDIKRGCVTTADAEKLMHAFSEWVEYEFRVFQKDHLHPEKFQAALKDLKWLLSVLSLHIPQVRGDTVIALVELLHIVLGNASLNVIPESAVILNTCLFSKQGVFDIFRSAAKPKLIERMLNTALRRMKDSDSVASQECLKLACHIGLAIPNDCPYDSVLYSSLFETFRVYFECSEANRMDHQVLSMLFGTIGALFLSNYDLIDKYHGHFSKYALACFRTRNSGLFQKLVNFFLIQLPPSDEISALESALLLELQDPYCLALHSGHPVRFLDMFSQFEHGQLEYLLPSDILRCSFVKLCCSLPLKFEFVPPAFAFFEPYKSSASIRLAANDPMKSPTFREWVALAESVLSSGNFTVENLQVENPLVSWFKISQMSVPDFDAVDAFLVRFFAASSSSMSLDPFVLKQIGRYFAVRFNDLWWSDAAEKMMKGFSDWLKRLFSDNPALFSHFANQEWLMALSACFFPSCRSADDCQNLSSEFQIFVLSYQAFRKFGEAPKAVCPDNCTTPPENVKATLLQLLDDLSEIASESGQHLTVLPVLKTFISNSPPSFDLSRSDSNESIRLFCKLAAQMPTSVCKLSITEWLSVWIPTLSQLLECHNKLLEKENVTSNDAFSASKSSTADEATLNAVNSFRCRRRILSASEFNLLAAVHVSLKLISVYASEADADSKMIINDWTVFLDEMLHSDALHNVDACLTSTGTNGYLPELKQFLNENSVENFYKIHNWTPFAKKTVLSRLESTRLAHILDDWIQHNRKLLAFPLLEGLLNVETISPATMAQLLLQENLDAIVSRVWPHDLLQKYVFANFAQLYAIHLLFAQSADEDKKRLGQRLADEILPHFVDSEQLSSLLKGQATQIIAYVVIFGSFEWNSVVAALRGFAGKLKVSTASDFSELIHPVHAVSILPLIVQQSKTCAPVIKLFQQVPILQKHHQLLFLTYNHVASDQKALFAEYANTITASWKLKDTNLNTADMRNWSLHEFILHYCDYVVWRSHPEAAGKLLYFMLNMMTRTGKKVHELGSFEFLDEPTVRRLRLFEVEANSRIFLSSPRLADDPFESKKLDVLTVVDLITGLLWMVKSSSSTATTETIDLLNCCELAGEDSTFARILLTFLFKHSAIESGKKIVVQKLTSFLALLPEGIKSEIWHDIIEALPVKQGIVSKIFQSLPSDPSLLKYLIDAKLTAKDYPAALYLYHLSLEQPRNRDVLDLNLLSRIHSEMSGPQDDYMLAIRKRLRQFDCTIPDAWNSKDNFLDSSSELTGVFKLMSKSLFVERTVSGNLIPIERKFCSWMLALQDGDPGPFENDEHASDYIALLRSVSRDRRVVSAESVKLIHSVLTEPSQLNFNIASVLPFISSKFEPISKFLQADISSKALWDRDRELAIETAKYALTCFPHNFSDELRALLLCRIGEWTGKCKAERPSHIISNYLDRAMRIVDEKSGRFSPENLAHIHLTVARFIDEQSVQAARADELERRSQLLAETRAALDSSRTNLSRLSSSVSPEERLAMERNIHELNQQFQADQEEYSRRLKDRNSFLLKSLSNYIAALSFGCKSETEQASTISRICALWFQHHQEVTANEIINSSIPGQSSRSTLSAGIKTVPVRCYLPLIYQLAARATYNPAQTAPNEFQKVLLRLLVQLLLSHPFDCIYQLLALRAGNQQTDVASSQAKRRRLVESTALSRDSEAEGRSAAAALVIDQVKKANPSLAAVLTSIEQLCEAYIELAKYSFPETDSKSMLQQSNPFPSNLLIKKLLYPLPAESPFKNIPIATCTSETAYFSGFNDRFRALRGINLPKLVEVISTSGSRHQQLVKGNDDVRQDAVMEQVFQRVNQLLKSDKETGRRKLSMRTYRVIPLRPLVGLIEFVSNSITLSDYLKSAHERLRPGDLKPDECRLKLQHEFDRAGSTVQSKLNVLVNEIGSRFKPVLSHFFFEHFQIADWWPARQAYIRSMATASILGWIVGLGDRHGMNILLDKNTGEVVHIDLNMIFEAGKTLRIPERVPFRLTPDCVEAMGPEQLGLEGPFKQNAIAVMKLLRKERNALMMILDVFKYDPLQKWTGMAAVAHKDMNACSALEISLNSAHSSFITKAADRALQRIREKLEGREEGSILSESGHVAYLIHTATDPEMLCQMFYGWQAYF